MLSLISETRIDTRFLVLIIIAVLFGMIMLYSASSSIAAERFGDPSFYFKKHLLRVGISVFIFLLFLKIKIEYLERISYPLFFISLFILIATYSLYKLQGISSPARWLTIGHINFQTSEMGKFSLVLFLSAYAHRNGQKIRDFKIGFLPVAAAIAATVFLILIQPDLSTAAMVGVIGLAVVVVAGAKPHHILSFVGLALIGFVMSIFASPYKMQRLLSFLNVSDDSGASYQVRQSLISLGNGGFSGIGIGESFEKNLFLPEPHTDFIFAIIGEEIGFIGTSLVLLLFFCIFIRGLKITKSAPNPFEWLLSFGLLFSMILYVLVNIAVVTKIFPVTGLPLPFFSYGGSSLMYYAAACGVILNISRKSYRVIVR